MGSFCKLYYFMLEKDLRKYQPDQHPNYRISQYQSWETLPRDAIEGVADLLGELDPWVKETAFREVLNEALAFFQEKLWVKKSRERNREDAVIVFLPEQPNFACHECFNGLATVTPYIKRFDRSEWIVRGLTRENLGWENRKENNGIVYLIGRIQGPEDLINFKQVTRRLRELGAKEITFLCPYLAWTRQDRPDEIRGEPETIASVMEDIARCVNRMATIDAHSTETARLALRYEMPFCSFSSWKYLLDKLREEEYTAENSILVGPDLGRRSHAYRAAEYLGVDLTSLDKEKINDGKGVRFKSLTSEQVEELRGKKVIIFDDIIASGTTLREIRELIGDYVESITVIASHASFIRDAIQILSHPKFRRVIITDSREPYNAPPRGGKFEIISCVPLINRFLKCDMRGDFNPWKHPYFQDTISKC